MAQILVIATHALIFFAPLTTLPVMGALTLTRVSRESFFFLSALVLTLAYGSQASFNVRRYVERRVKMTLVPYLAWTVIYWIFTSLPVKKSFPYYGLSVSSLASMSGVHQLTTLALTGYYHLYFLVVLFQLYVVFPFVIGWFRRVRRWHWHLVILAGFAQIALDELSRKGWMIPGYAGKTETRLLTSYPLYLVAGVVVGLNYDTCHAWLRRHGTTIAQSVIFLGLGALALDHAPAGIFSRYLAPLGDAFAGSAVAYNGAAIAMLWWLADRFVQWSPGVARRARRLGDDTVGIYLSQMMWIPLLVRMIPHLSLNGAPWPALVLVVIVVTFGCGLAMSEVVRRTPASSLLLGRARLGKSST